MLDLDAIAAEVAGEPLEVILRGKTFLLPPSMPVGLTVFLNRAMAASEARDNQAEDEATLAAVESLFGDRADEAMRAGFSLAALVQLATTYGVETGGEPPESPAEAGGSPASAASSNGTGTPSKPTSKPTTDSTSEPAASEGDRSASAVSSPS